MVAADARRSGRLLRAEDRRNPRPSQTHDFDTQHIGNYFNFIAQVREALAKCEFMARDRIGPT